MKKGLEIIIVDDNANFVKRMTGLLDELTNIRSIKVAGDYDNAVRLLANKAPDYILLDINLPGKSGIEILEAIKKNNWECKVIIVTNHANEYYRNLCYELGAGHFLDKSSEFGRIPEILGKQIYN